jgi:hypothetical protein
MGGNPVYGMMRTIFRSSAGVVIVGLFADPPLPDWTEVSVSPDVLAGYSGVYRAATGGAEFYLLHAQGTLESNV